MTGSQTPEQLSIAFNAPLIKGQHVVVRCGRSGEIMQSDFIQRNAGRIPNLIARGSVSKFYLCSSPERIDTFQRGQDRS